MLLQTDVRGYELSPAVPDRAADIVFEGVETEDVPTVAPSALARRGMRLACRCRKQCGPKCPCKRRKEPCHRKCGCKCKEGANCGNH